MFGVEIGKAFRRVRTYVLGGLLAAVTILPVVVFATSSAASGGPPFFDFLRRTGLFAPLAGVALIQPFILPLGTGLLAGEGIAAEASGGTLRYLLVRPVERTRLMLTKFASVMALLALALAWVMLVGLVAGVIAFGLSPMPTLSGATLSIGAALARIAFAAGYVLVSVAGLAGIGLFFSTITDSAPGATVATVAIVILSQILDALNALRVIHPYLLTHDWLGYVDLFRTPVAWDGMIHGFVVFGCYTVLFLGLAVWIFRRRDVVA